MLWQPSWQQRTSFIYSCANFSIVPHIGTKGCINYNPILARRQFGYPIRGAPTPAALIALVCYYKDGFDLSLKHCAKSVVPGRIYFAQKEI